MISSGGSNCVSWMPESLINLEGNWGFGEELPPISSKNHYMVLSNYGIATPTLPFNVIVFFIYLRDQVNDILFVWTSTNDHLFH